MVPNGWSRLVLKDINPTNLNSIDTFDNFTGLPSDLVNNVNYINIPQGAITTCNLYKYVPASVQV